MRRLIFLAALAGCGPIYDTVYSYTPPSSPAGKFCVDNCEDRQDDCERFENERAEYCEDRQREQMDRCADRISREKGRGPKFDECGKTESCTASLTRCEEDYRRCYGNCGGTVTSKQECVAFCDGAK